jgi:hypothetical protein
MGFWGGRLCRVGKDTRVLRFAENDEQQQPQQIMASELTTSPNAEAETLAGI